MAVIESLAEYAFIKLGEKISHPTFGLMEVTFIYKSLEGNYEMLCKLLEFNDTLKVFDAVSLSRVKFRISKLKVVK